MDLFKEMIRQGPVTLAYGAANDFFYFGSGIYTGACTNYVNHGMVGIGYGVDSSTGQEFVIIRNSWGTGWGEDGYVRVILDSTNKCDVYYYPNYPIIADGL